MLYEAYEIQRSLLNGASAWASMMAGMLEKSATTRSISPWGGPFSGFTAPMASALEVFAHAAAPRGKPLFDLHSITVDGKPHAVSEQLVMQMPFGDLKRFRHDGLAEDAPKLLIVAPMSGHYATLLRGTVERMLQRHEVLITDWADARLVPLSAGRFDLDDYIDYLIAFLAKIGSEGDGKRVHMMAVCQPSVPALAATAVMAASKHPNRPLSLTMMGGPIDTREAPTSVNHHAIKRPHSWFEQNVIATVPFQYPGAGRKVYPGFLQLSSFMSMNLGSHMMSHYQMFKHLVAGDEQSADATKAFYEEYRSVCDMTAEFYLQTIDVVFQNHDLPKGSFAHRGVPVDLGAIADTAILCIEGEHDDISGIGQTRAALHLATGLPEALKQYHLAPDVGHYGIFNGSKWRDRIAPVVESWIAAHGLRSARAKAGQKPARQLRVVKA